MDRYAYRSVMIVCDLLRACLIALLLIPDLPVWGMIAVVFAVAAVQPAYNAARVATLAQILTGDRLSVAIALTFSAAAVAQIIGYLAGGLLAALDPAHGPRDQRGPVRRQRRRDHRPGAAPALGEQT